MHVLVHRAEGEAKFWLEPEITLTQSIGLSRRRLAAAPALARRHEETGDVVLGDVSPEQLLNDECARTG